MKKALLFIFLLFSVPILSQDEYEELEFTEKEPSPLHYSGYVKSLQTFLNPNDLNLLQTLNFIHHRINIRYDFGKRLSLNIGNRNRFFTGSLVQFNPGFGTQLTAESDDYLKLSTAWVNKAGFVAHSTLDRFFLRYNYEKWEITLGRQRINWGINNLWNPNDLYNTFNFTDFDYEERPGSDAFRIKYYTGNFSSIEVAAKMAKSIDSTVVGMMYKFNWSNYDFQVLSAYYFSDIAFGIGWAGNLGDLGFKGEATTFTPVRSTDQRMQITTTAGIEYIGKDNLVAGMSILYSSSASTNASLIQLINNEITAKNLYPYKWALALTFFKSLNPLFNIGGSVIYSPNEFHPLFVLPTVTYSVKEDWDIDLVGQVIFQKNNTFNSPIQLIFLRVKWSY